MRTAPCAAAALLLAACGDNLTPQGRTPYEAPEVTPLACEPNLDGRIDAEELEVAYDVPVSYIVPPAGRTASVDIAGLDGEGGARVWDWGVDATTDQVARISASTLTGKWYAASFPKGQFAVPMDLGGALEAINSIDATGMYLHGIASREKDPAEGRTLYVYDPPVQALKFPVQRGSDHTSVGTVRNGTLRGLPFASVDTYRVRVDATGELILPDVSFTQVHRVRTDVSIVPAVGLPVKQKQVGFYFECFGEVARAVSAVGETNDDFTTATELRRLGL